MATTVKLYSPQLRRVNPTVVSAFTIYSIQLPFHWYSLKTLPLVFSMVMLLFTVGVASALWHVGHPYVAVSKGGSIRIRNPLHTYVLDATDVVRVWTTRGSMGGCAWLSDASGRVIKLSAIQCAGGHFAFGAISFRQNVEALEAAIQQAKDNRVDRTDA